MSKYYTTREWMPHKKEWEISEIQFFSKWFAEEMADTKRKLRGNPVEVIEVKAGEE